MRCLFSACPRGNSELADQLKRATISIPLDEEVDAHVRAALAEGLSARDAAVRVGRDLGVPRRRAYEIAIALRRQA